MKLGKLLGINDTAAAGLVASLANSIATFGLVKDMDNRGKVVNVAFAVSAAFVFGDHMGFTAGFAPELLPAVIVGKLTGGISAVAVGKTHLFSKVFESQENFLQKVFLQVQDRVLQKNFFAAIYNNAQKLFLSVSNRNILFFFGNAHVCGSYDLT